MTLHHTGIECACMRDRRDLVYVCSGLKATSRGLQVLDSMLPDCCAVIQNELD